MGVPPAYWPASGTLRVEKLSARYSEVRPDIRLDQMMAYTGFFFVEDGPNVLHDISFEVKSGERVGIVGRTGSGKVGKLHATPTADIDADWTEFSNPGTAALHSHRR